MWNPRDWYRGEYIPNEPGRGDLRRTALQATRTGEDVGRRRSHLAGALAVDLLVPIRHRWPRDRADKA